MPTQKTTRKRLQYWQKGDRDWHLVYAATVALLEADELGSLLVRTHEDPSTTLGVDASAGEFLSAAGTLVSYAGDANFLLTASATNALYLTNAGVLTKSTTGFPAATNIVPLAVAVTDATTVTSITPARRPWRSGGATLPQGTVTSVAATVPGVIFSVAGSPITASGTLAFSLVTQTANRILAGPTTGSPAAPTFRTLVTADLPAGTGTVTSVALAAPAIFTVSGSPVTATGTLTFALATQTANRVWAGPTTGGAAAPTFRVLVAADLPTTGLVVNSSSGAITADTDAATITFDCAASNQHSVTLGGNRTLAVTGDVDGQTITVLLKQDATGSRTVTWWAGILWPGGAAPTLTTTAGKTDAFRILRTGAGAYLGFIAGQNL